VTRRPPHDLLGSITAGRDWLARHSADLLPDTLAFASIGIRAAGLSVPEHLRLSRAGRVARALIPLSPAFETVAAAAAGVYRSYRGTAPLAQQRVPLPARPAGRRRAGNGVRGMDRATINGALADAVRARLAPSSVRWMSRRHTTGFVLTHQLLAWLLCVWTGARTDAPRRARRVARAVAWETAHVRGYMDLLAQQTAFLALGGWPIAGLQPLIVRILSEQDADGGWHYFERKVSGAAEALTRVCLGGSPLLGWPLAYREDQLGALAEVVHHVHRGHATALSVCALGVFRRAVATQTSKTSRLHSLSAASTGTSGRAWISSWGEMAWGSTSRADRKKKAARSG
jgi:hypothetical protein